MAASVHHGWGGTCAQEQSRSKAEMRSSPEGSQEEGALGWQEGGLGGAAAAPASAPSPTRPSLQVQNRTLALCLFKGNCAVKSPFFALGTRDDYHSQPLNEPPPHLDLEENAQPS